MPNPFEDTDQEYYVLVNGELQYSLWPSLIDVPEGWNIVSGPGHREDCIGFINRHWTDMRPATLQKAVDMNVTSQETE